MMVEAGNNQDKKRDTNFELLRIVAMLMIISLHFLGHGGVLGSYKQPTFLWGICEVIKGICIVAVNCFILLSGYYGITTSFKYSKLKKLIIQVLFYSIAIFVFFSLIKRANYSIRNLVLAVFPVSTNADGFSTVYIILYIISPYCNKLIKSMSQKEYRYLLSVLVFFFVVLPNIFCFTGSTIEFGGGYGIVWFVILYLTGAYIRLFYPEHVSMQKRFVIYVLSALLIPASCFFIVLCKCIFGERVWQFKELFYYYNSILVWFSSVALFGVFQKMHLKGEFINKIILFISPATFGVYLIHDNRFLRKWLWDFLRPTVYVNSKWLLVYMLVCVIGIFLVCTILEKIRAYLFDLLGKNK